MRPRNSTYWTGNGRLRPSSSRICSISCGAGLFAGHGNRRIARDEAQRQEHHRRHAQQHRDGVDEAAQNVGAHGGQASAISDRAR